LEIISATGVDGVVVCRGGSQPVRFAVDGKMALHCECCFPNWNIS